MIKSLHCHFKLIHWGCDVNFLQVYITFFLYHFYNKKKKVHPKRVSTQKTSTGNFISALFTTVKKLEHTIL